MERDTTEVELESPPNVPIYPDNIRWAPDGRIAVAMDDLVGIYQPTLRGPPSPFDATLHTIDASSELQTEAVSLQQFSGKADDHKEYTLRRVRYFPYLLRAAGGWMSSSTLGSGAKSPSDGPNSGAGEANIVRDRVVNVEWSPLGCAWDGGCMLSIRTLLHGVAVFSPPLVGEGFRWEQEVSVSDVLTAWVHKVTRPSSNVNRKAADVVPGAGERCGEFGVTLEGKWAAAKALRSTAMAWMGRTILISEEGEGGRAGGGSRKGGIDCEELTVLALAGERLLTFWAFTSPTEEEQEKEGKGHFDRNHQRKSLQLESSGPVWALDLGGENGLCKECKGDARAVAWSRDASPSSPSALKDHLAVGTSEGEVLLFQVTFDSGAGSGALVENHAVTKRFKVSGTLLRRVCAADGGPTLNLAFLPPWVGKSKRQCLGLAVVKGPSVAVFGDVTAPDNIEQSSRTDDASKEAEGGSGLGTMEPLAKQVTAPVALWQAHDNLITSIGCAMATGPCTVGGVGGRGGSSVLIYTSSMDGSCKEWEVTYVGPGEEERRVGAKANTEGGGMVENWGCGGTVRLRGIILGKLGRSSLPLFGCAPSPNGVLIVGTEFFTPKLSNSRTVQMGGIKRPRCRVLVASLLPAAIDRALALEETTTDEKQAEVNQGSERESGEGDKERIGAGLIQPRTVWNFPLARDCLLGDWGWALKAAALSAADLSVGDRILQGEDADDQENHEENSENLLDTIINRLEAALARLPSGCGPPTPSPAPAPTQGHAPVTNTALQLQLHDSSSVPPSLRLLQLHHLALTIAAEFAAEEAGCRDKEAVDLVSRAGAARTRLALLNAFHLLSSARIGFQGQGRQTLLSELGAGGVEGTGAAGERSEALTGAGGTGPKSGKGAAGKGAIVEGENEMALKLAKDCLSEALRRVQLRRDQGLDGPGESYLAGPLAMPLLDLPAVSETEELLKWADTTMTKAAGGEGSSVEGGQGSAGGIGTSPNLSGELCGICGSRVISAVGVRASTRSKVGEGEGRVGVRIRNNSGISGEGDRPQDRGNDEADPPELPGWARCSKGHRLDRCMQTLIASTSMDYRRCELCQSSILVPSSASRLPSSCQREATMGAPTASEAPVKRKTVSSNGGGGGDGIEGDAVSPTEGSKRIRVDEGATPMVVGGHGDGDGGDIEVNSVMSKFRDSKATASAAGLQDLFGRFCVCLFCNVIVKQGTLTKI